MDHLKNKFEDITQENKIIKDNLEKNQIDFNLKVK